LPASAQNWVAKRVQPTWARSWAAVETKLAGKAEMSAVSAAVETALAG